MVCDAALPAEMNVAHYHHNGSFFALESRPTPRPGPGELLVRVEAAALNRIDSMMARGTSKTASGAIDVVGLDIAGVVVARGAGCASAASNPALAVGARVMALLMQGGYAGYAVVHELDVMLVPSALNLVEAASVPEAWLTAFQLLHVVGEARPGQRLLLHAAGSGVGTAVLQLAVAHGVHVAAVASSARKLAAATALGATLTINRKEALKPSLSDGSDGGGGFAGALAGAPAFASTAEGTQPGGGLVDIVLDCVGGGEVYAKEHVDVLATDGVWVLFGLLGGATPPPQMALFGALLRKRLQLRATTLRSRTPAYKRNLVRRLTEEVLPFLRGVRGVGTPSTWEEQTEAETEARSAAFRAACPEGVRSKGATPCFRVLVDRAFPLRNTTAAHAHMLANANLGKIVLTELHEGRPGLNCACAAPPVETVEQLQGPSSLGDVNDAILN